MKLTNLNKMVLSLNIRSRKAASDFLMKFIKNDSNDTVYRVENEIVQRQALIQTLEAAVLNPNIKMPVTHITRIEME